jgi:large exoprotein involved in heme utilization and adhesion
MSTFWNLFKSLGYAISGAIALSVNSAIAQITIIRDGAQVSATTRGEGNGGQLTVNASESVEVIGSFSFPNSVFVRPSTLSSSTTVEGKAGDLILNTRRLRIQDRGRVSTDSSASFRNSQFIPGIGAGGNLIVNASESVELIGASSNPNITSGLFASTNTSGDAGKVTINTGKLMVRNEAEVNVSSQFDEGYTYPGDVYILGKAGKLNVTADSILLDEGKLTSNSDSGQGGDITLQVRDLLLMRGASQISTNAGTSEAPGDGGNITIDALRGFIVATPLENNDITANAFSGSGGKIIINANSIFGFVQRTRADLEREDPSKLNPNNLPTNDIAAFSQQNPSLSGIIQIQSPDVDPSKGLVELPANVFNASRQIVASCNSGRRDSLFVVTGRGGLASNPISQLMGDAVLADWIVLEKESENHAGNMQNRTMIQEQRNPEKAAHNIKSVNQPTEIVEAQGWVIDANGNVVLVAQAPTATAHSQALNVASCAD